jgi:hypothetical protein
VVGAAANLVQAFLVKKREFNIEGALEDKKEHETGQGFAQKISQERSQRDAGDSLGAWMPA